jgi:hypothetical protein
MRHKERHSLYESSKCKWAFIAIINLKGCSEATKGERNIQEVNNKNVEFVG